MKLGSWRRLAIPSGVVIGAAVVTTYLLVLGDREAKAVADEIRALCGQ